eukprot:gene3928-2796_t
MDFQGEHQQTNKQTERTYGRGIRMNRQRPSESVGDTYDSFIFYFSALSLSLPQIEQSTLEGHSCLPLPLRGSTEEVDHHTAQRRAREREREGGTTCPSPALGMPRDDFAAIDRAVPAMPLDDRLKPYRTALIRRRQHKKKRPVTTPRGNPHGYAYSNNFHYAVNNPYAERNLITINDPNKQYFSGSYYGNPPDAFNNNNNYNNTYTAYSVSFQERQAMRRETPEPARHPRPRHRSNRRSRSSSRSNDSCQAQKGALVLPQVHDRRSPPPPNRKQHRSRPKPPTQRSAATPSPCGSTPTRHRADADATSRGRRSPDRRHRRYEQDDDADADQLEKDFGATRQHDDCHSHDRYDTDGDDYEGYSKWSYNAEQGGDIGRAAATTSSEKNRQRKHPTQPPAPRQSSRHPHTAPTSFDATSASSQQQTTVTSSATATGTGTGARRGPVKPPARPRRMRLVVKPRDGGYFIRPYEEYVSQQDGEESRDGTDLLGDYPNTPVEQREPAQPPRESKGKEVPCPQQPTRTQAAATEPLQRQTQRSRKEKEAAMASKPPLHPSKPKPKEKEHATPMPSAAQPPAKHHQQQQEQQLKAEAERPSSLPTASRGPHPASPQSSKDKPNSPKKQAAKSPSGSASVPALKGSRTAQPDGASSGTQPTAAPATAPAAAARPAPTNKRRDGLVTPKGSGSAPPTREPPHERVQKPEPEEEPEAAFDLKEEEGERAGGGVTREVASVVAEVLQEQAEEAEAAQTISARSGGSSPRQYYHNALPLSSAALKRSARAGRRTNPAFAAFLKAMPLTEYMEVMGVEEILRSFSMAAVQVKHYDILEYLSLWSEGRLAYGEFEASLHHTTIDDINGGLPDFS